LRHDQREALLLVCANGLSYSQAAAVCNCAVGTIKSRIARARGQLLERLDVDRGESMRSARLAARRLSVSRAAHSHHREISAAL
jgi:hypothetical protein